MRSNSVFSAVIVLASRCESFRTEPQRPFPRPHGPLQLFAALVDEHHRLASEVEASIPTRVDRLLLRRIPSREAALADGADQPKSLL